jgi:hypothetical protein
MALSRLSVDTLWLTFFTSDGSNENMVLQHTHMQQWSTNMIGQWMRGGLESQT